MSTSHSFSLSNRSESADTARRNSRISGRLPNLPTISQASPKPATVKEGYGSRPYICSLSAGCSHLTRRLSGPALERVRECAHLMKADQPCDLGYMQLAVIEVTNRQIAPQLLKYFSEIQPFIRKLSCKRPLAHSQAACNVFHEHSSMRK